MCLGIPGVVVELMADHQDLATVDVEGVPRAVNIGLLNDGQADDTTAPALRPGDWILIHMGFALSRIDEAEAKASLGWVTGTDDSFADHVGARFAPVEGP